MSFSSEVAALQTALKDRVADATVSTQLRYELIQLIAAMDIALGNLGGSGDGGGGTSEATITAAINAATLVQTKGLVSAASIGSITTATAGANYTALAAGVCTEVLLINLSGTQLEYRRGGAGSAIPIPDRVAVLIEGLDNSSEVGIRRTDSSNTQVSASFERRTRG